MPQCVTKMLLDVEGAAMALEGILHVLNSNCLALCVPGKERGGVRSLFT